MIDIIFFHDRNWKIKGFRVVFGEFCDNDVANQIHGLLLGTKLALQELKAYHCKSDDDDVYEIEVTRQNKNTAAVLQPLIHALRYLVMAFPHDVAVKHF